MWKSSILIVVAALALAFAAAPPAAMAATAEVVDNAGFFSPDAVAKANQQLADVAQRTGKHLRVETYAQVPPEIQASRSASNDERYIRWAEQSARQANVNGAIVLITRDPGHLQVVVDQRLRQSGVFPAGDRDRMSDVLTGAFRAKNYDQGLLAAVDLWRDKVGGAAKASGDAAQGAAARTPSAGTPEPYRFPNSSGDASNAPAPVRNGGGSGFGFGTLLFFGVLIFLGFMLVRRLFGGRRNYQQGYGPGGHANQGGYGPGYGRGGAGGFGSGMGGGLLGGLLGSWIGNNMFGHGGSSAHGNTAAGLPPTDPNAAGGGGVFDDPASTQFSAGNDLGGGGDFSSGGGGDFSGGGDSGGGGDF